MHFSSMTQALSFCYLTNNIVAPVVGATGYWEGLAWSKPVGVKDSHGRTGIALPVEIKKTRLDTGRSETGKVMLTFWERYTGGEGPVIVSYLYPGSGGGQSGFIAPYTTLAKAEQAILDLFVKGKASSTSDAEDPMPTLYEARLLTDAEVAEMQAKSKPLGKDSLKDTRHLQGRAIEHRF